MDKGVQILLVDDEEQIRKLLWAYLSRQGYKVATATDGIEALREVKLRPPALVITDVGMPNMNGYELTRRLRSDHLTARIPILMLSARKEANDILTGYSEGADEYVSKPIEMAVLAAKIEVLLKRTPTKVDQAAVKAQGRVVLFAHGKGGVGNTSLAVNTAVAMAESKKDRVGLLDLNLEFSNAHLYLDLKPARSLSDFASFDPADLDDEAFARLITEDASGVRLVMGCDSPEKAELITVPLVQQGIDRMRSLCDYVVIDTPATFSQQVLAALDSAEVVAVVTGPHLSSVKAAKEWLQVLDKLSFPQNRTVLVLNRVTPSGLENDQVTKFLERRADIVVPYTPMFDDAANRGRPLVQLRPDNVAANLLRDLAAQLTALAPAGH
jgi:pilus assembly protein CpaE